MPDPIDKLSTFEPGVPMSPLPPSEVRRRGDRLRRRNTAVVVGGAVAAVVLAAVPVAVLAGNDGGDPTPVGPATATTDDLLTADELPAREDLDPWREASPEGPVFTCAPDGLDAPDAVRRDFEASITGPGPDDSSAWVRTQVLSFDDAADARGAYQDALDAAAECPGHPDAHRDKATGTLELEDGQAAWLTRSWVAPEICGGECDAAIFDRMGVAQLDDRVVLVSLAQVGGPLEPEGLDGTMEQLFSAAVTKAGGEIAGGTSSGGSADEGAEPEIPLATGLPEADGSETVQKGPGPRAPGAVELSPCDRPVWPQDGVERLAVTTSGPEFAVAREVVALEDTEQAVAVVDAISSAVLDCPTEVNEADPTNSPEMAWEVVPANTGQASVSVSQTYVDGMPGGQAWQFTQVGRAVLVTYVGGEYTPGRSITMAVRGLTDATKAIAPSLCRYTDDGC